MTQIEEFCLNISHLRNAASQLLIVVEIFGAMISAYTSYIFNNQKVVTPLATINALGNMFGEEQLIRLCISKREN